MATVSHYVLLHQEITLGWRRALEHYLHQYRVTSGQSVDDALRLAADEHHITLVGSPTSAYGVPAHVEAEILAANPAVHIDRMNADTTEDLEKLADLRAERGDRYGARDDEVAIVISEGYRKMGVDSLQPIHDDGHFTATASDIIIAETNAHWVRVNFVYPPAPPYLHVYHQDSWAGPGRAPWLNARFTATNKTWYGTFDELVNAFAARGLSIYGLVGMESTHPRWAPERMRNDVTPAPECHDWVRRYAESFAEIVDHFRDRVKVFESFNEPNGWHGGTTHILHPFWYARCLVEIFKAVVIDKGISDITLVTGPVECPSFPTGLRDQFLEDRKAYLRQAYNYIDADPAWSPHKVAYGYPFHGVGLHLYLYQNRFTSNDALRDGVIRYVRGFHELVREREGAAAASRKKIYISEIGWMSGDISTSVEEARRREIDPSVEVNRGTLDTQARYLEHAFRALTPLDEVGVVSWYGVQDTGEGPWGLYGLGPLDAANRKPSWDVFHQLAAGEA